MLLAVVKGPAFELDAGILAKAAAATGLTVADLGLRLRGILPRVLLSDTDEVRIARITRALEAMGFVVATCDPSAVAGDDDRVMARGIEFTGNAVVAIDGRGARHDCPAGAIGLIQRGLRVSVTTTETKTTERKFSAGKAVLTGGLMLTSKVDKVSVASHETRELFLIIERKDGEPDLVIYERQIDYRFLGADMQPSSVANFERTQARVRALAPGAAFDERVARAGFVSSLPRTSADATDLAVYLVSLAHTRTRGG